MDFSANDVQISVDNRDVWAMMGAGPHVLWGVVMCGAPGGMLSAGKEGCVCMSGIVSSKEYSMARFQLKVLKIQWSVTRHNTF